MMTRIVIITAFLGLFFSISYSQDILEELDYYGDVMVNAAEGKHRIRAAAEFESLFQKAISAERIEELKELKWVSHVSPEDGSFDLFSWQLKKGENQHSHGGYIIPRGGTAIALKDTEHEEVDLPYMELSSEDWFGVLYYDVKTLTVDGEAVYILFGYDGADQFNTIKVAESVAFERDQVLFGSKAIFSYPQAGVRADVHNRLFFKYSEFSNLTLGYDESLGMILFDHLIPRMGTVPGQGPTQVSDGSYEAFAYQEGKLNYIPKVFDQISAEAPMPEPVLGKGRSTTINGEKKVIKEKKKRSESRE